MTEAKSEAVPKESIAFYLYGFSAYLVVVGVSFQIGFWTPFHVNVLEYLNLVDIIKPAAQPVFPVVIPFVFGIVLGAAAHYGEESTEQGRRLPGRIARFLRSAWPALVAIYAILVFCIVFFAPTRAWNFLPYMFALPLSLLGVRIGALSFIPSSNLRLGTLMVLIHLPFLSYGQAKIRADDIVTGRQFEYVVSPVDGFPNSPSDAVERRLRYLGLAGDHAFYFDPQTGVVGIEKEDSKRPPLRIKHYAQPSERVASAPTPTASTSTASSSPRNAASRPASQSSAP